LVGLPSTIKQRTRDYFIIYVISYRALFPGATTHYINDFRGCYFAEQLLGAGWHVSWFNRAGYIANQWKHQIVGGERKPVMEQ
jgi:hypothetical protein